MKKKGLASKIVGGAVKKVKDNADVITGGLAQLVGSWDSIKV